MPDSRTQRQEIPFSGRLRTGDPVEVGADFQTLKNMRYADTHVRGIRGMTLIGGLIFTETDTWGGADIWGMSDLWGEVSKFPKTKNAFHFVKSQPVETHVLSQRFSAHSGGSSLFQNTATIPFAGVFSDEILLNAAGDKREYFSSAPEGKVIVCNGIDTHIWGGDETICKAFLTSTAEVTESSLTTPIDYSLRIQNTKTDVDNLCKVGGTALYLLVGSTLPLQNIKIYIAEPNVSAATMTGKEWTGLSWSALSLEDNTSIDGKSLSKTGTVTFPSTVTTSKPNYIEGHYLYWYQFILSACDNTTRISHITVGAPFQKIIDLWDGVYRRPVRFYKKTTSYLDNTINVLEKDYHVSSPLTYSDLSNMAAFSDPNNCLEIGFLERQTGIFLDLPPDYINKTASTKATVGYWNGSGYVSVGTVTDGTAESSISLAKPGVISWNANGYSDETAKSVNNSPVCYFYRIYFDKALSASVRVDYVGGITKQREITNYKFPMFAQGRVFLCGDMSQDKHKVTCSGQFMPQVYNGSDSVDVYFGSDGELTCGIELFSLFGASLYSLILMFKDNETWIVAGTNIHEWNVNTFLLSSTIGCPSPLTLKTINLSAEPGAGVNRALAIWQGANGIYMSDGRAPIPIHGDIAAYFDESDPRCITPSMIGNSVGFVDPVNKEYHWLFASGPSTNILNKELVYDIVRNKWYEIDRGMPLQFGITVYDVDGNAYTYGFLDNGGMYRLENGTDFAGTDIACEVQTGDIALAGLTVETQLNHIRLITKSKTVTGNDILMTHYSDGSDTGTDFALSPARSGYRIAQPDIVDKLIADPFHSFKLSMTTNDETIGFEPFALGLSYHLTHQDT